MGDKSLRNYTKLLCLASAVALAGCVSSPVSTALESASQPVDLNKTQVTTLAETSPANADIIPLPSENIPVPSKAPRPVLALAPDSSSQANAAAEQTAAVIQPTSQTVSNEQTAIVTTSESQAVQATQQLASATPTPPKKPSFFELLRQRAEERRIANLKKRQEQAEKTKLAKLTVRERSTSKNATLPGVAKGKKLFGIEDGEPAAVEKEVKVASVGGYSRSLIKNGLILQTSRVQVGCFKPELMKVLKVVERRYGRKVMVTSGYRSPTRNRRAGGVRNSTHVYCKAADIQVKGVSKWTLAKFLRTIPGRGGVGTYCRTQSVHIDVGSKRDWHHPCRRRTKKRS